jgi:type II secretory pathway component PulK
MKRRRSTACPAHSGSVLVIVLWTCFGLAALALTFAHSMSLELRTAAARASNAAARAAAEGGMRYAQWVLTQHASAGQVPRASDYEAEALPVGEAIFSLIGRDADAASPDLPFFGLVDEAAKLNLNTASQAMLEALPEMTPDVAAAILDWRDSDAEPREQGAEDETYSRLTPARRAKNGPFETVEELRLVHGVTLELLYGEDANLNGVLDPNEDDGDLSPPLDDRNGVLRRGLIDYLTVHSAQPNRRSDGSRRLDLTASEARPRLSQLLNQRLGESRAAEVIRSIEGRALSSVAELLVRGRLSAAEFARVQGDLANSSAALTRGLVNVNTAPEAVLACIPGIGETGARAIVAYRLSHPEELTSIGWLPAALPSEAVIQAGPFITGESYQFLADIEALGPHGQGRSRLRAIFDLSSGSPRLVLRQEATRFGRASIDDPTGATRLSRL